MQSSNIIFFKMIRERDWFGLAVYFGMGIVFVIVLLICLHFLGMW